ncbi:uncharacterized protein N7515_007105 [Penicillium bovifimosum]|uniref:Uncharacterized protein n=1 Tax=Penicillium bovifimosum TaxID=126998 RepID=A0A9W9GX90_9EURO|nr:uncharacterized protein N7515_007105 [Penicillium bovifimosum]KAJ5131066.1 hypothetical protein N7515_007105 [Penicillium bovifimosum]
MTAAFEKGRNNSVHAGSNGHNNVSLADSFASQQDNSMLPNQAADSSVSRLLVSRYPSDVHPGMPKDNSLANRVSRNGPSELLGLLAPSRTNQNRDSAIAVLTESHGLPGQSRFSSANAKSQGSEAKQEMDGDKTPKQQSFRVIANKAGVAEHTSTSADKPLYSNFSQEVISRGVADLIAEVASQTGYSSYDSTERSPSVKSAAVPDQRLSKKRTRASSDAPSQKAHDDDLDSQRPSSPALTIPSKRQRTDTGEMMPTNATGAGIGDNDQVPPPPAKMPMNAAGARKGDNDHVPPSAKMPTNATGAGKGDNDHVPSSAKMPTNATGAGKGDNDQVSPSAKMPMNAAGARKGDNDHVPPSAKMPTNATGPGKGDNDHVPSSAKMPTNATGAGKGDNDQVSPSAKMPMNATGAGKGDNDHVPSSAKMPTNATGAGKGDNDQVSPSAKMPMNAAGARKGDNDHVPPSAKMPTNATGPGKGDNDHVPSSAKMPTNATGAGKGDNDQVSPSAKMPMNATGAGKGDNDQVSPSAKMPMNATEAGKGDNDHVPPSAKMPTNATGAGKGDNDQVPSSAKMPTNVTGAGKGDNDQVSPSVEPHVASTTADLFRVSATDPWEGMIKNLCENTIPKDQAALLDQLVWVPQSPGVSGPLCNVPPYLLTKWNDVSQRRKLLAERQERLSEHPPTPTPQDTQSDAESEVPESDWPKSDAGSPAGSPARDTLPRDTVTPPRQTSATTKNPTISGTRHCVSQATAGDEVDIANQCASSAPKDVPIPTEQQIHRPPGRMRENPKSPESLVHNPDDEGAQEQTSLNLSSNQPPVPIQKRYPENQSITGPLVGHVFRDESSDDESDDTEMETSVPCALGGNVPISSQNAGDLTNSGPSLPDFTNIIQVMETPVVNINRLSPERDVETSAANDKFVDSERQNKQSTALQLSNSQQPSSEAVKTSSLSEVPNTYRSEDNQGQSHISQQAPNPSMHISQDESPRLDVLGTQTQSSSMYPLPQMPTQSSSDVVLDSSRPAQRQRGSSIFHLDPSDDLSSFPYTNVHSLPASQVHGQSQGSSKAISSLNGLSQVLDSSPREFPACVAIHAEPLPKDPPISSGLEDTETRQEPPHSPTSELVARRQGFLGKLDQSAEAQTIYEKFRNGYSSYTGDFAHFTEMCSRLQAMRKAGMLQRSFLWDDFVIQHLLEYPRHLAELESQKLKTLRYEDFFWTNFSRPQHKKRSLTARGLDVIVSQSVSPVTPRPASLSVREPKASRRPVLQNNAAQGEGSNPPFTGSLVENFSNLHARSFGDVPVPDVHMPTATQILPPSSTTTSAGAARIKEEVNDSPNILMDSLFSSNHLDQKDKDMVDATQPGSHDICNTPDARDIVVKEEIDETQDRRETNDWNDTQDSDDAQDAEDADHSYHEAASVELGDETDYRRISPSPDAGPPPAPSAILPALHDSESELEPPRQRSNWFRSLANIFPTGPVWSDDPNTPFKTWARQDQNLLLEINRRGGTRVQVDAKGVICRPTYNLTKNPDYQ